VEHEQKDREPGDVRMDRAMAVAFATPVPRPVAESVIAEIEGRAGIHAGSPTPEAESGTGRYRMLGEIGRGGIGIVFEGRDRDLSRSVALKVLRADRAGSGDLVRRFIEEAQIAGQLEHPGVVPVYDLGVVQEGIPYFTMKLVRGWPLSNLLAERESPAHDLPRFLAVFEQVCQTIAYAHSRGVIHRDLKPANVMVGDFGEVQVLDWGLAKILDRKDPASGAPTTIRTEGEGPTSAAGTVLGTPEYMAPEQAQGALAELNERTDVFALGAILLEILTGEPPYSGEAKDIVPRAIAADPGPVRKRLAECAADRTLTGLCESSLAPEPADRPASAGDVAAVVAGHLSDLMERARQAELAAVRERSRAEAEALREEREARTADWERAARRRTLALAATVLLAVLIGGGTILARSVSTRARRDRAAATLAAALEEVSRLEGEGRLEEAATGTRVAIDRATADGADPVDLNSAEAMFGQLVQAAEDARVASVVAERVDALLAELKRLRSRSSSDFRLDPATVDADYVRAFAEFGITVDGQNPEKIAAAIAGWPRSREIAAAIAGLALNRRFRAGRREEGWRPLLEAACLADPDPWLHRLWDAALAPDRERLLELAETAEVEALPARTIYLLGYLVARQKEHRVAADLLRRGRERYPDDVWIGRELAQSVGTQGAVGQQAAVGQAMATVALCPENACYWSELGMHLGNSGDLSGAIRAGRKSLTLEPDHAWHFGRLGWALLMTGENEEAERILREAIARDPAPPQFWGNLGAALLHLERPEEALRATERALGIQPALFPARMTKGNALHRLGRSDEAEALFRQAIRDQPRRGGPRLSLAGMLLELDRPEDAHAVLLEGVGALPNHWRLWYRLGDSHVVNRRHAEALEAYERSVRFARGPVGEAWIRLAAGHARLGHLEEAARWFAKAAAWIDAHAPDDEELRGLRAETEAMLEGPGEGR